MVMVEVMTCGTPVVALLRGSVPEVVVDAETGIVVDDPAELGVAVATVGSLDRRACRAHADRHFDTPRRVGGYEATYRTVAEARELRLAARPYHPALIATQPPPPSARRPPTVGRMTPQGPPAAEGTAYPPCARAPG